MIVNACEVLGSSPLREAESTPVVIFVTLPSLARAYVSGWTLNAPISRECTLGLNPAKSEGRQGNMHSKRHRLGMVLASLACVSSLMPAGLAGAISTGSSNARHETVPVSGASRTREASALSRQSTRVAVRLRRGVSASVARKAGSRYGFRVVRRIPSIGWTILESTNSATSAAKLARQAKRARVASVAYAEIVIQPESAPNDPLYPQQWGYENVGQSGGTVGADARIRSAWNWSNGTGAVVAVTDTGVDLSHPDLAGQAWVNEGEIAGNGVDDDRDGMVDDVNGWDFYNGDATVFDASDGDKHGTHVSGTIAAATGNATGGSGTANRARIMALKFIGPDGGSDVDAASAIVYAVDHGASVINASWGSTVYSQVMADAVAYAASHGVLIAAAAGNSAANTDTSPNYPASYPATNVVSVAALDRNDQLAGYSNYGSTSVDLGAPGSSVLSTQPRLGSSLLIDKSPYRAIYHAFPVESVTDASTRAQIITRSVGALATTSTPILVVDDSWAGSFGETVGKRLAAYTSALASAGYTSVSTWRTDLNGVPSSSSMSGKTVVWFTGGVGLSTNVLTLSSSERTSLGSFLDGGGRLVLSSGDLGWQMNWIGGSALTWYRTYLHATYADDDPWTGAMNGRSGGLLSGLQPIVSDPLRRTDGFDDIMPWDASASLIADWEEYAIISGTSMATPHVTGTLALMRSRMPELDATQMKQRLLGTVRPVAGLSGACLTQGSLNAAAAVGTMDAPAALAAVPATEAVALSWSNPIDPYFASTRILMRTDAPVAGPDDASATVIYEGTGTEIVRSGLAPNQTINFAAYSRNTLGSWSSGAFATATPRASIVAAPDNYSVLWDSELSVAAPGLLGNDEGDALTSSLAKDPENGIATVSADGSFSYRPNTGFYGSDSFVYRISNGSVWAEGTVTIDVRRFRVDSVSTDFGAPGTSVTFTGTGFGDIQGGGFATFGGTPGLVVSWSDTVVTALVPEGALPGWAGVVRDGTYSNGFWFRPYAQPQLDSLSVSRGGPGTAVTFYGTGFGDSQGTGYVTFAGVSAPVLMWSDTAVTAIVPTGTVEGYAGVIQNGLCSNGKWFVPSDPPHVDLLSTTYGAPGTLVTFTGSSFGDVQGRGFVTFGGVVGNVVSWSDTTVTASVPVGAGAGWAGVVQGGDYSNGIWFRPFEPPVVDSLSAYQGWAGDVITITGSGFGDVQGSGWATFGGTSATVLEWSDTSVTVVVPLLTQAGYVGVVQNELWSNGKYFTPGP